MLARGIATSTKFLTENGGRMGSNFSGARFIGGELAGKTLGLLGLGRVGVQVAQRALAFDMRVLAYDPNVTDGGGVTLLASLEELLAQADFVSIHARSTAETRHIIDAGALAAMRRGAWLINTARESLVDEEALRAALDSGHVAGAALDVLEPPPADARHRLIDHPNVVITPHIGGATRETLTRGAQMMADAVRAFAAGDPLPFLANRPAETGALE
jgi:phosphoglycerate dehydrogenase-like enzyme